QFMNVRCASRSTCAGNAADGWFVTNSARMRVIGGALTSAVTLVLCAMRSIRQFDVAFLGDLRPFGNVVAHVLAELRRRHGHDLERLAREPVLELRVGEHLVDLAIER